MYFGNMATYAHISQSVICNMLRLATTVHKYISFIKKVFYMNENEQKLSLIQLPKIAERRSQLCDD